MKIKTLLISLLAFVTLMLNGCSPNNDEYADKVIGTYNLKITPNLTVKYDGQTLPVSIDAINTTCYVTKGVTKGNVIVKIDGVNGVINNMDMTAICSGLGMDVEDSTYDGIILTKDNDIIDCNLTLKNTSSTITNSKILNWKSTVSGKCEMEYVGLDITCNVSGTINFYATMKTAK